VLLGDGKQNSQHSEWHLFWQNEGHHQWITYDNVSFRTTDTRDVQKRSRGCNQRSIAATWRYVGIGDNLVITTTCVKLTYAQLWYKFTTNSLSMDYCTAVPFLEQTFPLTCLCDVGLLHWSKWQCTCRQIWVATGRCNTAGNWIMTNDVRCIKTVTVVVFHLFFLWFACVVPYQQKTVTGVVWHCSRTNQYRN